MENVKSDRNTLVDRRILSHHRQAQLRKIRFLVRTWFVIGVLLFLVAGMSISCRTLAHADRTNPMGLNVEQTKPTCEKIPLRWIPTELSSAQVAQMIKLYRFYERDLHPENTGANVYTVVEIDEDIVVIDCAHDLMWATGIVFRAAFNNATEVLATMHYAGFNDWRVPTLEELVSLFEPKQGTKYADKALLTFPFDGSWSADVTKDQTESYGWYIRFDDGIVTRLPQNEYHSLLPVRSTRNVPIDSKTGASVRGLPNRYW